MCESNLFPISAMGGRRFPYIDIVITHAAQTVPMDEGEDAYEIECSLKRFHKWPTPFP